MIDMKDVEAEVKPVVQTLHDLARGDDRTTAIIGGAFVEDILEEWLRRFLKHGESFKAKTELCFTIGLIGPIAHKDFDLIRKIRNKFAHKTLMLDAQGQLASVSFKTPEISAWSKGLELWETLFRRPERFRSEREKFILTCGLLHLAKLKSRRLSKPFLP